MGLLEGLGKVPTSSLILPAGACVAGCIVGGLIMKKVGSCSGPTDTLPEKWVKVGQIKDLLIYPIKGMPGKSVDEAVLGRLGLKATNNPHLRDRVFIIVNETGKFFSLGKFPIFALTRIDIQEGNKLHLSHSKDPSMDIVIDIPTSVDPSLLKTAVLYGEKVKGMDCGDKVSAWLSRLTDTPGLRLLYHVADDPQRGVVKRNAKFPTYRNEHTGAFQDETSYMLMTDESVAALNTHMEKPVSHLNFRPTIVVNGISEPFAEDFWGFIRVGSAKDGPVLKGSMPCQRCNTTTVDPETGTFREDGQPLRALYKMKRQVGTDRVTKLVSKAAIMGTHFGVFEGEDSVIRVGDPVYAALV
jgi:uncharacterized protein YcbX